MAKVCPMCGAEYGAAQTFCSTDGATLRPKQERKGDLTDTVVADRYRVVKKLGEGGMGQVYLAEHVRMKRRSALKVMRPDVGTDPDAVARFTREATNASRIEHPNVAAIHDFGETSDGLIYLAMEFVEGEPLAGLLEREGAMPPRRVASIIRQAAAGLQAAHELHIVHRDLKPDNIMVARAKDGGDKVKIVDFGIAKVTKDEGQKVTSTGVMIGTPAYMSPEQVAGGTVEGPTDQFSLACTAFEMLTGALPFAGTTTYELITARITGGSRRLDQVRSDVAWPAGLEDVLRRAMAPKPEDRFPDVAAFAAALEAAVEGMPAGTAQGAPAGDAGTMVMRAEDLPRTKATVVPEHLPGPVTRGTTAPAPVPAGKKGGGAMIAAAAAALLVVGGGAAFMMRGGGDAGVAPAGPSAQGAVAPAAASATGSPTATPAAPQADPAVTSYSRPAAAMPTVNGGAAGSAATRPAPQFAAAPPGRPAPTGGAGTAAAVGAAVPPPVAVAAAPSPAAAPAAGPAAAPAAGPAAAPAPAGPAPFDARGAISAIKQLAQSDDDAQNKDAIGKVQALLPKLTTRADSVLANYYRAQAHASLGENDRACRVLSLTAGSAEGSALNTIKRTMSALECP